MARIERERKSAQASHLENQKRAQKEQDPKGNQLLRQDTTHIQLPEYNQKTGISVIEISTEPIPSRVSNSPFHRQNI